MLHALGLLAVLMCLLASQPAFADSTLSQLLAIDQATSHLSPSAPPRVKSQRDSQMEAGFCAPGMACYASAARSEDPMLIKVARHLQDRQVPQNHAQGTELAPLGVVVNHTLEAYSTAFLVGECHVLTTAHSVVGTNSARYVSYNPELNEPKTALKNLKLEFRVGKSRASEYAPFAESVTATVEVMGKYSPYNTSDDEDWALLRLSKCWGTDDKYGHFALYENAELNTIKGKPGIFASVGFPGDRDMEAGAWIDPHCTVHDASIQDTWADVWATDCNAVSGMSGAPMIRKSVEGKIYVFGITTSQIVTYDEVVEGFSVTDANHVLSTKAFYSQIKPYIQKTRRTKRD